MSDQEIRLDPFCPQEHLIILKTEPTIQELLDKHANNYVTQLRTTDPRSIFVHHAIKPQNYTLAAKIVLVEAQFHLTTYKLHCCSGSIYTSNKRSTTQLANPDCLTELVTRIINET